MQSYAEAIACLPVKVMCAIEVFCGSWKQANVKGSFVWRGSKLYDPTFLCIAPSPASSSSSCASHCEMKSGSGRNQLVGFCWAGQPSQLDNWCNINQLVQRLFFPTYWGWSSPPYYRKHVLPRVFSASASIGTLCEIGIKVGTCEIWRRDICINHDAIICEVQCIQRLWTMPFWLGPKFKSKLSQRFIEWLWVCKSWQSLSVFHHPSL